MIRSPLDACRERSWETLAVAFAVVVVLAIPLSIALTSICARSAAEGWLASYTPMIYLEPDAESEAVESLRDEIANWPLVESATVRTAEQAHGDLVARLGEETVTELGVSAEMLPRSISIAPSVPVAGHIDLVSRVSGLEARVEVDTVEVPSSEAMRALEFAGVGLAFGALLALFGLLSAGLLLASYLKRLRALDEESDRVLALFGAYERDLRKPTLWRGVSLGGACGVLVALLGSVGLVSWRVWAPHVVGFDVTLPTIAWPVAAAPLLVVPIVGAIAALAATRDRVQIWRRAHG